MYRNSVKNKLAAGILLFALWAFLRFFFISEVRRAAVQYLTLVGAEKGLFNHSLILLEALLLFVVYYFCQKQGWVEKIHFQARGFKLAVMIGIFLFALTIPVAVYFGMNFSPHLQLPGLVGNLISNAGEEVIYRGILFVAALAIFKKSPISVFVSSLAFGAGHWDMPVIFQGYVAIVGMILGWTYLRTGGLWAPYLAHVTVDILLDSLFK